MATRIRSYRELTVWREAMDVAEACYLLTRAFPREDLYGITSQLRRSSASIPANIAEGYGRDSRKGYLQFVLVAQGSLKETETHLLLAQRVGCAPADQIEPILALCDTVGRRLNKLVQALRQSPIPNP